MFCWSVGAQIPTATLVRIVKAEDARAYGSAIEDLMKSPSADIRKRAALAAGRIGDDKAITALAGLLESDSSVDVRTMAAFAIGEVESIIGADAILKALSDSKAPGAVRARSVEAAGKIAAAHAKDEKAKSLAAAIIKTLTFEDTKRSAPDADIIRLGLTAALRARPEGADESLRKFLAYSDPEIVADALNAMTRLRAKKANRDARDLLKTNVHALVRANAARLLGAAEDKEALEVLIKAATTDTDSRARVAAIRSLGSLKDPKAADKLIEYGEQLAERWKAAKIRNPAEKNEMLEIATVLGRLLAATRNQRADQLLRSFIDLDREMSAEFADAWVRVTPSRIHDFQEVLQAKGIARLSKFRFMYQTMVEASTSSDSAAAGIKSEMIGKLESELTQDLNLGLTDILSGALTAYAKLKPESSSPYLLRALEYKDLFVRSTAAGLIADQPKSKANVEALKRAFGMALVKDKNYNDAQLAILGALYKLDKKESVGTLLVALNATDYLVRKRAFELLADKDLQKEFPGILTSLEQARSKHKDQVLPYSSAFGTKLGQVLHSEVDYRRAVLRKNGSVKAVLTTEKGIFTIVFDPEDAPLTVDNFIKLARANYFNGLEVHRVVPNFVMQDGDPRGDGDGGPGWSIRCEVNMLSYDRGVVGMALSGKDTGGSQWFVTHSPQPHLDGGYTVFGHVNETDMKVVDNIVRGDKILTVKIVETGTNARPLIRK